MSTALSDKFPENKVGTFLILIKDFILPFNLSTTLYSNLHALQTLQLFF